MTTLVLIALSAVIHFAYAEWRPRV